MEERKILADRHRGQSWPKMLRRVDGREQDKNKWIRTIAFGCFVLPVHILGNVTGLMEKRV
jgi:hypothetical protein